MLAEITVCCIGRTEADGMLVAQLTVATLACAGTCEDVNLERTSGSMFRFRFLCNLSRYALWRTCWSKTTKTDCLSVFNKGCDLGSRNMSE